MKRHNIIKNHCKYPSIDFYRTSKSTSSFNSIFNYCTFNNYDNINNEFYNEYNKKSSINIYQNKNNKERQSKINNFVKNHYKLKKYYEDKKRRKKTKNKILKMKTTI